MDKEIYGIVGVIVGSLLGTLSSVILDRYNRSKRLFVDAQNAGFTYPTGDYQEELSGHLALYVYNDSSLPKTFLLENIILEDRRIYFSVRKRGERELATGIIHQIAPSSGLNVVFDLEFSPDIDIRIPDIKGKKAILKYRSGKHSNYILIPLFYYDPF